MKTTPSPFGTQKQKKSTSSKSALPTFFSLLSAAKNEAEQKALCAALLTPTEMQVLQERVEIVYGLIQNKTQRDIAKETGASLATVSRGSRELKFGSGILQTLFSRITQ